MVCIRIRKSRPNPDFLPPDMSIKIRISYVLYVNKATVQARRQLLQCVNSLVGCLPTRQLICWLLYLRVNSFVGCYTYASTHQSVAYLCVNSFVGCYLRVNSFVGSSYICVNSLVGYLPTRVSFIAFKGFNVSFNALFYFFKT